MGQAYQVTIVLNIRAKKDKTITRERGILTRLIKLLVTPQREENDTKNKWRNRGDDRRHKIHQFHWRIWKVWWVEGKDKGNFQTQGNP